MSPSGTPRRNLFAVTAASFVGFMGFTLVMPFLPLYFHQLGVNDLGRLADRFGRKIMVERSLVSFVIVMSWTAFATQAWHVFALRALQGVFAGYGALALTMAADSAPRGRMPQAIGTVQTAQRLGPALGPVFGGSIAALVGLRRAFLVAAACYLVALVLVFLMYDERIAHAHREPSEKTGRTITFRNVLAFENFLLMALVIFGLQFVDRSFGPILPLYVGQLGIASSRVPFVSGLLFSIAAGAGAIGHHYCASLLRSRTAPQLIVAASGVGAAASIVYVAAPGVVWLFLATPFFGLAIGAGMTAAYTAAAGVIPASARGAGFGLLTTASLVGLAVSPIVSGLLGATSIRAVWALDVVGLLVLAVIVHRFGGDTGNATRLPVDEPVPENV